MYRRIRACWQAGGCWVRNEYAQPEVQSKPCGRVMGRLGYIRHKQTQKRRVRHNTHRHDTCIDGYEHADSQAGGCWVLNEYAQPEITNTNRGCEGWADYMIPNHKRTKKASATLGTQTQANKTASASLYPQTCHMNRLIRLC